MKKIFEEPVIEIECFVAEDVITASGGMFDDELEID